MASLSYLDMSYNQIEGGIPRSLRNLSLVETLNLAANELYGSIPEDIGNLFNLNVLNLSDNQLTGTLPESIGRLSKLESLYLGSNHLEGIISEVHLFNLSMLRELDLSFNSFQFKISSGFVPPFQLESIQLVNCTQGPQFPEWLRTQRNVLDIDMSRAQISDTIPAWFWDLSSVRLSFLNFSHNLLYGKLPDLTSKNSLESSSVVDLSSNNMEGPLPLLPPSIWTLNLFQNSFSGSLESMCNSRIHFLDVSDNLLTGMFPDCFRHIGSSFVALNLANNNLGLQVIDLGKNKLSGSVPAWIGDNWPSLVVLSLRSNGLYGEITSSICHMTQLQILDLSLNKINGTIPKCLNNLTAMVQEQSLTAIGTTYGMGTPNGHDLEWTHDESAIIMWKGVEPEYKSTVRLVKAIDLSSNHLTGEIPIEITRRIPSSTQLQTFEVSTDKGNSGLCGKPVTDSCPGDEVILIPEKTGDHNEVDTLITTGFYISLGLGFVFGFWGTGGSLLFKKSWRHTFFKLKHAIFTVTSLIGSMIPPSLGNLSKLEGSKIKCIDRERQALLKFKEDLVDADGVLSSWETEEECCKWRETRCDNETNPVTALDFQVFIAPSRFGGNISPSLLKLQRLSYLDLSYIDLPLTKFQEFMVNLIRLIYLNLSGGFFEGAIPQQLGNLSELQYLDYNGFNTLFSTNLDWLSSIPSLNSISYVDLSLNTLQGSIPDSFLNMASLSYVSMSFNEIERGIPRFLGNLSLESLDLAYNYLYGELPEVMKNLFQHTENKLKNLDISWNGLNGTIPESISGLCAKPVTENCLEDESTLNAKKSGDFDNFRVLHKLVAWFCLWIFGSLWLFAGQQVMEAQNI
ncbi:hypothetical protein BUALT_Bualt03G0151900 [Buddleja alternifolia]|uniref:Leucine-rich repeat-containing N-terminal plant-type domain-containing protein n=1 Tax=Buddleja alternifolia TaxID=168488 RepID=A0AAV6XV26_9LAMI|nr:hypothetical protein BUALT_Bualt03G0151900 [Buddleja alternifolia]